MVFLMLVEKLLSWFKCHYPTKLRTKLVAFIYWNGPIIFFLESGLDISVCTVVEYDTLKERLPNFVFGNWVSLVGVTLFFICFLGTALFNRCYLRRHHEDLHGSEQRKDKYGALYEGLNLDLSKPSASKDSLFYAEFFVYRRIIFSSLILISEQNLWLQFMVLQFNNMASTMILVYHNAYAEPLEQNLAVFTEIMFFMISYVLYVFTDFVEDAQVKSQAALIVIGLTVGLIIVLFVAVEA